MHVRRHDSMLSSVCPFQITQAKIPCSAHFIPPPLLQAGFYFRNPVFQAFVDAQWSEFRGGDNACTPAHLRMLLTSELAQRLARAPPAAVPQPDSCRPGPESSADGPWIEGGTTAIDDEARQSGAACNCSREALHEQRAADAADGQAAAGEGGGDVGGESKELLLCLQGAFNQAASIRWTHQALQVQLSALKRPHISCRGVSFHHALPVLLSSLDKARLKGGQKQAWFRLWLMDTAMHCHGIELLRRQSRSCEILSINHVMHDTDWGP